MVPHRPRPDGHDQYSHVYTLLEDGKPARANQLGVAVYQDGTWKVGVATFCSLLAMENGGRTSLAAGRVQAH
jgi:hypothetical protein